MPIKNLFLLSTTMLTATACAEPQFAEKPDNNDDNINFVKPNFVIFIADDCSHVDIGCYGSVDSKTPNIDKFATEGVQFTQGYQAVPMSSPTRHNLLTGVWPVKSGAYPNHTQIWDEDCKTIIQHMQPLGYNVSLFGKGHIAPAEKFTFDEVIYTNTKTGIDFTKVESYVEQRVNKNEKFCMVIASNEPHSPWDKGDRTLFDANKITLPPMLVDTKITRNNFVNYLAEVNYMDNQFGDMLSVLERTGVKDNTVVIFLSEQGNSFPFAKWTLYDMGVKSAYIARWPGVVEAGRKSDAIVEYVDVVPTFIDIAGGTPDKNIDGKSFKNVLLGKKDTHKKYTYSIQTTRGIFSGAEYYGIRAVSNGKYRYIINLTPEAEFKGLVTENNIMKSWKEAGKTDTSAQEKVDRLLHRPAVELYDVENDMYCMNNLAGKAEYTEIQAELDAALKAWMKECGDEGQATELRAKEFMKK